MADRMLDKIALILHKAENATTDEEAATYMEKAQKLASLSSIELAVARQHTAKKSQREQPTHKRITIGEARKGNLAHYCELFHYIALQNDVQVNLARNSTFVIAFGMPSDIEVVEVLYASLAYQMVEAANAWLKTGEFKNETVSTEVTRRDSYGSYKVLVEKPLHGKVARANFYRAYTVRIGVRLADARYAAMEDVKETAYDVTDDEGQAVKSSAEIVMRDKAVEVRDYYKSASTARGTWKGPRTSAGSSTARTAGDNAGRSARLGANKAIGGSRTPIAA